MGQGSAARGVVAAIMVACSGPGTGYCERYRVATSDFLTFSQERPLKEFLTVLRQMNKPLKPMIIRFQFLEARYLLV